MSENYLAIGSLENDGQSISYEIHSLTLDHLDAILDLEAQATKELGRETFAPFTRNGLIEVLKKGQSYGAFIDNQLIGTRLIDAPMEYDLNIHRCFNIPEDERLNIVDICGLVIEKKYRQLGLASRLTTFALDILENDDWKHAYATVSPNNIPSLSYMLSLGFEICDYQQLHSNKARFLFHKRLGENQERNWQDCKESSLENLEQAISFFKQGYRAIKLTNKDDIPILVFALIE